ncbi:MAG: YgiT-type zinc finger protein, partial [Anaerolineae bacterium]|nr:YgiT-type zinc finger protein [Anaerolineae bacterium]
MNEPTKLVCPRCQIGLMQARIIPYNTIENGHLVSVSKMPARVCDVCGNRVYERESLLHLRTMLGASRRKADKPSAAKKTPAAPKKPAAPRKPKAP